MPGQPREAPSPSGNLLSCLGSSLACLCSASSEQLGPSLGPRLSVSLLPSHPLTLPARPGVFAACLLPACLPAACPSRPHAGCWKEPIPCLAQNLLQILSVLEGLCQPEPITHRTQAQPGILSLSQLAPALQVGLGGSQMSLLARGWPSLTLEQNVEQLEAWVPCPLSPQCGPPHSCWAAKFSVAHRTRAQAEPRRQSLQSPQRGHCSPGPVSWAEVGEERNPAGRLPGWDAISLWVLFLSA